MVDGVASTDLMRVTMEISPQPSRRLEADPGTWQPAPAPRPAELAVKATLEMARSPFEQLRAVQARARAPRASIRQLGDVVRGLSALRSLAQPTSPSTLNGPMGPHRRYSWASATVADVKTIRTGLGGTVNDVVLGAATRGFRDLLLSRGESVDRVARTLVPVSVRVRDAGGRAAGDGTYQNKVSAMYAELPVGLSDPRERLNSVRAQMENLKESKQAVAGESLTSMSGFAPPVLLALGTRLATRIPQRNLDTMTTNVPGPQIPLYLLGRKMLAVYPWVALGNQLRVGVTVFSYNGQVSFGVAGDYDTAPDIDVLCTGIEKEIAELVVSLDPL